MKEIKCRDLRKEEIECRVGSTNATGFSLLLYKTARADMTLLDETYGVNNWQCKYYQVKNTMICAISIWDEEKQQWIEKSDGGDDDFNAEKVKGECSDAFKRAGFRVLPSTRKLYNSPFIWITETEENKKNGRYEVKHIKFDEDSVCELVIVNEKTKQVVYSYPKNLNVSNNATTSQNKPMPQDNKTPLERDIDLIEDYFKDDMGRLSNYLMRAYKVDSLQALTSDQVKHIADTIRKK